MYCHHVGRQLKELWVICKENLGDYGRSSFHNLEHICSFITTACILHNVCILNDEDIEEFIEVQQNH